MAERDWTARDAELRALLQPPAPPLAITFSAATPPGVPAYDAPLPPPTPDGRTGRVPAGCVFWIEGAGRTFTTAPEDHGNCSVGSLTHGLKRPDEVAGKSDVAALLEAGWATPELVAQIPAVRERARYITYGPLAEATTDPDVILLRLNAKQVMVLHDAVPGLRFEGKPQCHIIPLAKEEGAVAVSVGCMLSRVRTGLPNGEMTCALPARRLPEVIARLRATSGADRAVAAYASRDARRFGR